MGMIEKAESEYTELLRKRRVIESDKKKIRSVIEELDEKKKAELEHTWVKVNRDFGSNGSYSDGTIMRVAGMQIIKSNNLVIDHTSSANVAKYPDYASKYTVNGSDTKALIIQKQALGTVQLMDMATEMEYDIRRQGTLAVSKIAVGHGVLRPECIIELRAAA
jgi:hypothetical protein